MTTISPSFARSYGGVPRLRNSWVRAASSTYSEESRKVKSMTVVRRAPPARCGNTTR